jgi:3-isopropylmalate dehydratase small subunit
VEALIQVVDGEDNGFSSRNHAVWALGQIGNEKAKAVIEKYYTGIIPEREPYDKGLSQYEMKKALKLLNGGLNVTHLVWKIKEMK